MAVWIVVVRFCVKVRVDSFVREMSTVFPIANFLRQHSHRVRRNEFTNDRAADRAQTCASVIDGCPVSLTLRPVKRVAIQVDQRFE